MTTRSNDQMLGREPAPAPVGRWGKAVAAVLVLGLGGAIAVRTVGALDKRATVTHEREQAALAAAQKATAEKTGPTLGRGQPASWQPSLPVEGSLKPKEEADIGFKASGRLGSVLVSLGSYVKQGQVLATLDQSEALLSKRAAEAQVRAAAAQLSLAEDAERRTANMLENGAIAAASGVQAKGQLELGAAQLEAARAQLALATAAVQNHTLVAPFAGYVTKAPTSPGGIVGAGTPLFRLEELSTLRLTGSIGETDASLVKVGDVVSIEVDGRVVEGRLTAVVPSLDTSTRRIPIEAEVPNDPKRALMAGSFVRARVRGGTALDVLKLPAVALRQGSQDEVFVVQQGKLVSRRVRFTTAEDGALLVRAGLGVSDDVLFSPSPEAREGDAVAAQGERVAR